MCPTGIERRTGHVPLVFARNAQIDGIDDPIVGDFEGFAVHVEGIFSEGEEIGVGVLIVFDERLGIDRWAADGIGFEATVVHAEIAGGIVIPVDEVGHVGVVGV